MLTKTLAGWTNDFITAIDKKEGQKLVGLFDPKLQIRGKEKVDIENLPQEMVQPRKQLHQYKIAHDSVEQDLIMQWCILFLHHSKVIDQQGSWSANSGSATEIFNAYIDCFKAFEKVCAIDYFDSKWISPIVEHMTELLVQYAENADEEHIPLKKNAFSTEGSAEARQTEKAQSLMESLFRKLIHG